jgi:hypothetical protein
LIALIVSVADYTRDLQRPLVLLDRLVRLLEVPVGDAQVAEVHARAAMVAARERQRQ